MTVSLSGKASAKTKYNPGGVLPEVASPASWSIFLVLLAVLIVLLFVPGVIDHFLVRKSAKANVGQTAPKSKSRIKLK